MRSIPIAVAAALALAPAAASALSYTVAQTFLQPNHKGNAFLGASVATLGGNVLVGAPLHGLAGAGAGAVFLLDGSTGARIRAFSSPAPSNGDLFGTAVAAVGPNVLVGAPHVGGPGAAYLFDGSTGALLRTFVKPNPVLGEAFGASVAAVGSNVLVGDFRDDTGGTDSGAAYLFDASTGALLQTFLNPTPANYDEFGTSVAALGGNVLVGALNDGTVATSAGAVYLFDAASGALLHTYVNPLGAAGDLLGCSVAAVGGNVVAGAKGDDSGASEGGAAYLFNATTEAVLQTFVSPTAATEDQLGWSVAAVGSNVLAGAPQQTMGAGLAVLFDAATGSALATIPNPYPAFNDSFGLSVTTLGNSPLVGAPFDDTAGGNQGAAYLFDECGNGVLTPFEQCDDGNAVSGDGCSSACLLELCGSGPSGGCVAATPQKGSLLLKNGDPDSKDKLTWKWKGTPVDVNNFGHPLTTASYALCVYDGSGATQPLMRPAAPTGGICGAVPCWKASGATGFIYKDKVLTPNGLSLLSVKASASQGKMAVKGKGLNLRLPTLQLTTPVIVQLKNTETSFCWEATYSTPTVNDADQFKAKND